MLKVPRFSFLNTGFIGGTSTDINNVFNDGGQITAENEVSIKNAFYNKAGTLQVGNKKLGGNWGVIGNVLLDKMAIFLM